MLVSSPRADVRAHRNEGTMRAGGIDRRRAHIAVAVCLCAWLAQVAPCRGADADAKGRTLEQPPQYGLYYDRYEPAFYTGFAPRTLDPKRLHVHLGRGNQLRVTVVLSDEVLREYAKDLRERRRSYRALVDSGRLVLTQNRAFEEFERRLDDAAVERMVAEEASLPSDALRERNLQLLERLTPGRVFRIRMSVDDLIRRWVAALRPADHARMDTARQLELLNLMLPTRLYVAELKPGVSAQLAALVHRCPEPGGALDLDQVRPAFVQLFERVSDGIYPVRDGMLDFAEFTAIYPVGTFNQYTTVRSEEHTSELQSL